MESMGKANWMHVCEVGECCNGRRQPSRPDGRLLAERLMKDLPLSKHEEFNSCYIDVNLIQIWGLAFQRLRGKPQVGGMPSSHDSGEEWERKFCCITTAKGVKFFSGE